MGFQQKKVGKSKGFGNLLVKIKLINCLRQFKKKIKNLRDNSLESLIIHLSFYGVFNKDV